MDKLKSGAEWVEWMGRGTLQMKQHNDYVDMTKAAPTATTETATICRI